MAKIDNLYTKFKPSRYTLIASSSEFKVTIDGQKTGPPSYRITLNQTGLKISSAKVIRFDKSGPVNIEIDRITLLPSFEQVRLHSQTVMYPGQYHIEIDYNIPKHKLLELGGDKNPDRSIVPSIDEPDAWQSAIFGFKP